MTEWLVEPYSLGFMREAAVVAAVVGVVAPTVGVWVALRRLTYLGDAMSHATVGGVALGVVLGVGAVAGALGAGALVAAGIGLLQRRRLITSDAAIGIASVTLFAFGVLLISRGGFGVDISHVLFGQIVALGRDELWLTVALGGLALGVVAVTFRDLELSSLDPVHARQVGVRVGLMDAVVLGLVTVTVVICLSSVGLLMSVAMLVVPANTARLVARTTPGMTVYGVGFGVLAALGGLTASYHLSTSPGATIALSTVAILVVVLVVTRVRSTAASLVSTPRAAGGAAPAPAPAPPDPLTDTVAVVEHGTAAVRPPR